MVWIQKRRTPFLLSAVQFRRPRGQFHEPGKVLCVEDGTDKSVMCHAQAYVGESVLEWQAYRPQTAVVRRPAEAVAVAHATAVDALPADPDARIDPATRCSRCEYSELLHQKNRPEAEHPNAGPEVEIH